MVPVTECSKVFTLFKLSSLMSLFSPAVCAGAAAAAVYFVCNSTRRKNWKIKKKTENEIVLLVEHKHRQWPLCWCALLFASHTWWWRRGETAIAAPALPIPKPYVFTAVRCAHYTCSSGCVHTSHTHANREYFRMTLNSTHTNILLPLLATAKVFYKIYEPKKQRRINKLSEVHKLISSSGLWLHFVRQVNT